MEHLHLPLLVLEADEAPVLPGERRRLRLESARALTAVRLAQRDAAGHLAVLAFDPAQRRQGETPTPGEAHTLPVATACRLLRVEEGFAVVRGERRVTVGGTHSGGCCQHDDPYADGTEAHCDPFEAVASGDFAALEALLRSLDLLPRLRAAPLEDRLDRLARWLALPAWALGEVLCAPELDTRMRRIADGAREIASPGGSFRDLDLHAPYRDAEEHFEDLVRDYESRARAQTCAGLVEEDRAEALVREERIRARRRAAAVRVRAGRARIAHRLAASAQAGCLPTLEQIRAAHDLGPGDVDALLVAALGNHERFRDRLQHAARLLPPEEMPLGAWIAALEAGAFPTP
jgi:hypothetical protein